MRLVAVFALLLAALSCAPEPYTVRVIAEDFNWRFRHAGPDGRLDTADDRISDGDLVLPAHRDVLLEFVSRDYIYGFELPDLDQRQSAVPDLDFSLRFRTPGPGRFPLMGSQMCGYDHPTLLRTLIVSSDEEPS